MKITKEIILSKKSKEKLVALTAYTYPIAKIIDQFCDIVLVGDSLGMTIYGMKDTIDVNLEMMINHGKAVTKACKKSFIVVDLPFGSYEKSKQQALESAKKIIDETKCDAVKIEVNKSLITNLEFLVKNNINVMGHVGLLPQSVRKIGGYRYQGTDDNSAQEIFETAILVEEAGAFSLVIEAVPANLATKISQKIKIPTIGIGASLECDGQILVIDDLLGLNQEFKPKFVNNYEELAQKISQAVENFANDVKLKNFPKENNLWNFHKS